MPSYLLAFKSIWDAHDAYGQCRCGLMLILSQRHTIFFFRLFRIHTPKKKSNFSLLLLLHISYHLLDKSSSIFEVRHLFCLEISIKYRYTIEVADAEQNLDMQYLFMRL